MITKIKKDDKFVCINSRPNVHTTVGEVYTSHADGEIYSDNNFRLLIDLSDIACQTTFSLDFIPYTYAAISAHYRTLAKDEDAMPFAKLLNGMDKPLASERDRYGRTHDCNSIYSGDGVMNEFGFVTREQLVEIDRKISEAKRTGKDLWKYEKPDWLAADDGPVSQEQIIAADKMIAECGLKQPNVNAESTKPNYYKFNINGTDCNMFDIARSLDLSLELFSALKYFRMKGDTAKRINDLQKAKECIDLEIANLNKEITKNN
jgi:hypothetical protein